jgi:hypothetical protein
VGDISKNRFENIIVEFAPKFENLKLLARELRFTLFPIRDRDIFTGTFHDYNIIYDKMIIAFNIAIGRLGNRVGNNKLDNRSIAYRANWLITDKYR